MKRKEHGMNFMLPDLVNPSDFGTYPRTRREFLDGAMRLSVAATAAKVLGLEASRAFVPDYIRALQIRDTIGAQITDPGARARLFEGGLPAEVKPSRTLAWELNNPMMVPDPGEDGKGTGQKLNTLVLNADQLSPDATVNIYLPRIFNPIEGLSKYGIEQIAATRPGEALLAFDLPSMGESNRLTRIQREVLDDDKSTREIARTIARIIQRAKVKSINIIGPSLGSLVGAELANLAPEYGIDVKDFIAICPTGVKEFEQAEMFDAFTSEGQVLDVYHSWPYDPRMRKESFLDAPWIQDTGETVNWLLSNATRDGFTLYSNVVLESRLPGLMHGALEKNSDMKLTVMYGTADPVSPVGPNRAMVADLQFVAGSRVRQIEYSGEHHAFMDNGRRIAGAVNDILNAA